MEEGGRMGVDIYAVICIDKSEFPRVYAFSNEVAAKWCEKVLREKGYRVWKHKTELFDQILVNHTWHGEPNDVYCISQLILKQEE